MRKERLDAAEITQLYSLWNEYAEAINTNNVEQLILLWCNDGIHMPPDFPKCLGKAEIRKHIENQITKGFSINLDVVHIIGDHAYSHGTFSSMLGLRKGSAVKRISGKFLSVLKKQDDGFWKILIDCFNYDNAMEQDKKYYDR